MTTIVLDRPARTPLRQEMFTAFTDALDCPELSTMRRAYLTGRGIGYAAGFGLLPFDMVRDAMNTPRAMRIADFDTWNYGFFDTEETSKACGVLDGFWQATSEQPDATECSLCGNRILTDSMDHDTCPDGLFCPIDCHPSWHASTRPCDNTDEYED